MIVRIYVLGLSGLPLALEMLMKSITRDGWNNITDSAINHLMKEVGPEHNGVRKPLGDQETELFQNGGLVILIIIPVVQNPKKTMHEMCMDY